MTKKIIIGVLFAGLIGVLVWGGVNRTLAKDDNQVEHNQGNNTQVYNANEDVVERHGKGNPSTESGQSEEDGRGHHGDGEEDCDNEHATGEVHEPRGKNASTNAEAQEVRGRSQGASDDDTHGIQGGSIERSPEDGYRGSRGNGKGGNGNNQGAGAASEPLDESEIQALNMALDDEYHALATYLSVMDTFGEVEPFASIAQAEQRHIDALVNQFNKYGIPVPENTWLGNIPAFDNLSQACQAAADAEIANAELYEELFSMTDNSVLLRVFANLGNASIEHHLPEFEACK